MAAPHLRLIGPPPNKDGTPSTWNGPVPPEAQRDALAPNEKLVHFVRHAEGIHNIRRETVKTMVAHDAHLVPSGIEQCQRLKAITSPTLKPELVVASPLTRTLQTAVNVVDCAKENAPPLVAVEHWRETVNFLCDGRRSLTDIAATVPGVDFSHCPHDEDAIWEYYAAQYGSQEVFDGLRETADMAALHARAQKAVEWIGQRPEKEVVVVSHAAFLKHLFSFGHEKQFAAYAPCFAYEDFHASGMMRTYFGNAEMRSVVLAFPQQEQEQQKAAAKAAGSGSDNAAAATTADGGI